MYCVAEKSRKNTTLTYSIITLNCCFGEHVNKQFIYTSSRKILLKFKKGRSKALFMLKNLYSDGFLHGVVLKNIDTRRIDLWHSFLQGHATKEHRHHMLFELPSSPDILFDKKKIILWSLVWWPLAWCLLSLLRLWSLPTLLLQREYTGGLPELTLLFLTRHKMNSRYEQPLVYMSFDPLLV